MFREFLGQSDLLVLPLIALGIFFLTFLAVLAHLLVGLRKGRDLSHIASLPLDDDPPVEASGSNGRATNDV